MLDDPGQLKELVDSGATFMDVLSYIASAVSPLRPIDFLRVFQEDLGIPFPKAREILEYFDPAMQPMADESLINERGREILLLRSR